MDKNNCLYKTSRIPTRFVMFGLLITVAIVAGVVVVRRFFYKPAIGPVLTLDRSEIHVSSSEARSFREQGQRASGTFSVSNEGDADLEIHLNYATCACRVKGFGPEVHLRPGETAPLTLELPPPWAGTAGAAVELVTNSKRTPKMRVRLTVDSDRSPPYFRQVQPKTIFFQSADGEPVTQDLFCSTVELTPTPWVEELRCDIDGVVFGKPSVLDEPHSGGYIMRSYRFPVTLTQSARITRGVISLYTAPESAEPIATVHIRGERSSAVHVSPNPVFITAQKTNMSHIKRLLVRKAKGDGPFQIRLHSGAPEWIQVSVPEQRPSNLQTIELSMTGDPGELPGPLDLVFTTNVSDCPEFHVQVYIVLGDRHTDERG